MLLCYRGIKLIVYVFFVFTQVSCSDSYSENDYVSEFYARAEMHESELKILQNVSYTVRGFVDGKPFLPKINIAISGTETITLPGISNEMSREAIAEMPFSDNINLYAKKKGIPDSLAFQEVRRYLISITDLASKLQVYKVQSTPRLGNFIIFYVSDQDQVIYLQDLDSVKHDNWRSFFQSGNKLDEKWYYRKLYSKQ